MTSVQTRREAETLLIDKAEGDPDFRKRLLSDPTATVAEQLGIRFGTGVRVHVVEETDRDLYLVLPAPPAPRTGELADGDLAGVSGGVVLQGMVSGEKCRPGALNPAALQGATKTTL